MAERREDLNLSKLDGITVTFNLHTALNEIAGRNDLVMARKKRTLSQSYSVTAGCVFGVMRGERYLSHVILDAAFLTQLVDDPQTEGLAANIVAHELAHVGLSHWLIKPAQSYVFPTQRPDWRYEVLRYLTLSVWDEYGACRLSARFGDSLAVTLNFMNCLRAKTVDGLPKLWLYTRKNWHLPSALTTFVNAAATARRPLLSAAYLMGHIDGLGVPMDVATLCTAARISPLNTCWTPLRDVLRGVWSWQADEFGFEALDGLVPVLMEAIRICGGGRMITGI